MSLQLERSKQLEYNLAVLKRRDAAITRVLDMAGHVVLYQFNEETKAWDRRNMEGSLFVVERSSEPRYQFVVLNRLSSENLIETIDDSFQTELTDQFLLYRNLQSEILGVWFYSAPERQAISELLDKLHAGEAPPPEEPEPPAPPEPPAGRRPTNATAPSPPAPERTKSSVRSQKVYSPSSSSSSGEAEAKIRWRAAERAVVQRRNCGGARGNCAGASAPTVAG